MRKAALALATAAVLFQGEDLFGQMPSWASATNGDWFTASNWSTGQVPAVNGSAVIDAVGSPYSISSTGSIQLQGLFIDSADVQTDLRLRFNVPNGTLVQNAGSFYGQLGGSSAYSVTNAGLLAPAQVGGTWSLSNSGSVVLPSLQSSTLTISNSGTVSFPTNVGVSRASITNSGTILIPAGGGLDMYTGGSVDGYFGLGGSLYVEMSPALNTTATVAGKFVGSGLQLATVNRAAHISADFSEYTGAVSLAGGTFTFQTPITYDVSQSQGTLLNAIVERQLLVYYGSLLNTTISFSGTLEYNSSESYQTTANVENFGYSSFSGSHNGSVSLTNRASGVMAFNNFSSGQTGSLLTGTITNHGTVVLNGIVAASLTLHNSGTISLAGGGTFSLLNSGLIKVAENTTPQLFGSISSSGPGVIDIGATSQLRVSGGGTLGGMLVGSGPLLIDTDNNTTFSANTSAYGGSITIQNPNSGNGSVTMQGDLFAPLTLVDGTVGGSFTAHNSVVMNSGTLTGLRVSPTGSLSLNGGTFVAVENEGYAILANRIPDGELINRAGGNASVSHSIPYATTDTFVVRNLSGGTTSLFGSLPSLVNHGFATVAGTFSTSSLSSTGTFSIDAGRHLIVSPNPSTGAATVELGGFVTGEGSISITTGSGTMLSSADYSGFTGTMYHFAADSRFTAPISAKLEAYNSVLRDAQLLGNTLTSNTELDNVTVGATGVLNYSGGSNVKLFNSGSTIFQNKGSGTLIAVNQPAGTMLIQSIGDHPAEPASSITNFGTLIIGAPSSGGGTVGSGVSVINQGSLEVPAGLVVAIGGPLTSTPSGMIELDLHSNTSLKAPSSIAGVLRGAGNLNIENATATFSSANSQFEGAINVTGDSFVQFTSDVYGAVNVTGNASATFNSDVYATANFSGIEVGGSFTLRGNGSQSSGTVAGMHIAPTGAFSISGGQSASIVNEGNASIGTVAVGTFTNLSGGQLSIGGGTALAVTNATGATVSFSAGVIESATNAGVLDVTGPSGASRIVQTLSSTATLSIALGSDLSVRGGSQSGHTSVNGTLLLAPRPELIEPTVAIGGTVSGSGQIYFGTYLNAGTITSSADYSTFTGSILLDAETTRFVNPVHAQVRVGQFATLADSVIAGTLDVIGGTVRNTQLATTAVATIASPDLQISNSGSLTIQDSVGTAEITNLASGRMRISTVSGALGVTGTLTNHGTVELGNHVQVGMAVANFGTLAVQPGASAYFRGGATSAQGSALHIGSAQGAAVLYDSGPSSYAGAIKLAAGSVYELLNASPSPVSFRSNAAITGDGVLNGFFYLHGRDAEVSIDGPLTVDGPLLVLGGSIRVRAPIDAVTEIGPISGVFPHIEFESSALDNGALTGRLYRINGGAVTGSALQRIGPQTTVELYSSPSTDSFAALDTNNGTLIFAGQQSMPGSFSLERTLTNNGVIRFEAPVGLNIQLNNLGTFQTNVVGGVSAAQLLQIQVGRLTGGNWHSVGNGQLHFLAGIDTIESPAVVTSSVATGVDGLSTLTELRGTLRIESGGTLIRNNTQLNVAGTLSVGSQSNVLSYLPLNFDGGGSLLLDSHGATPGRFVAYGGPIRYLPGANPGRIISVGNEANRGVFDLGGAVRQFEIGDSANAVDLSISARLDAGGIEKTGDGLLSLDAPSSYEMDTVITAGTLRATVDGAIPAASRVQIGNGTLLVATPLLTVNGIDSVDANPLVQLQNGTLELFTAQERTYSGTVAGSGGLIKTGVGAQNLSGPLQFSGPLRVDSGLLALSSAQNTFAGAVSVSNGGTLAVSADSHLGAAANSISLAGGALRSTGSFSTSRAISLNSSGIIDVASNQNFSHSGTLTSTGLATLTKTGSGKLILAGGDMAGTLAVGQIGGELSIKGGRESFPNISCFTADVRGTLVFDMTSPGAAPLPGPEGSNPNLSLSGGTFTLLGQSGTLTTESLGTLTLGAGASTIRLQEGDSGGRTLLQFDTFGSRATGATLNVIARDLAGSSLSTNRVMFANGLAIGDVGGWLTITDPQLTPNDPSDDVISFAKYTAGGIEPLSAGDYVSSFARDSHVQLTASATVPDDSGTGGTNPYTIKTLTLDASTGSVNVTIPWAPPINTLSLTQGGLIKSGTFSSSVTGGTLTSSSGEMNINVSAGQLLIDSRLDGAFTLTKRGAGTLQLTGAAAATYSGATVISGFLELNKSGGNAVPGTLNISGGTVKNLLPNQIADTADIIINAGTYNLNGQSEIVRKVINNNGTLLFGGGTLTVTQQATLAGGTTTVASTFNVNTGSAQLLVSNGVNTVAAQTATAAAGVVNVGAGGLIFDGSASPSIGLQSASGTFSPAVLNLAGDVSVTNPGTGTARITNLTGGTSAGRLDLGAADRTFSIASGTARDDLDVSAAISGAGGIIKTGPGALRFSGAGSYGGGVVLHAGIFEAASNTALGTGTVTINAGTLSLRSNNPTTGFGNNLRSVTATPVWIDIDKLDNAGVIGTFRFGAGTLGGTLSVAGNGTMSIGSGTQTHSLESSLVLSSYTESVIDGAISGGTNELIYFPPPAAPGSLPGEGLTRRDRVGAAGTLTIRGLSATNSQYGGVVVNGGQVNLNRPGGTIAVPTKLSINSGTVQLFSSEQIADNATLTLNAGAVFNLAGNTETIGNLVFNGGSIITGSGALIISGASPRGVARGGNPEISVGGNSGATLTGQITFSSLQPILFVSDGAAAADLELAGQVNAPGGFTKIGSGNLALKFNNTTAGTLSGSINILDGVVTAAVPGALGIASVNINGGALRASGPIANHIAVLEDGASLDVPAGVTANLNGALTGTGTLTKDGNGTLALVSPANSLVGEVHLNSGTLRIDSDSALGNATNRLKINGGVLQFAGSGSDSVTRDITAVTGGIDVPSPTAQLTIAGDLSGVQSGTITSGWSLDKHGAGTLTLSATELPTSILLNTRGGHLHLAASNLIENSTLLAGRSYGVINNSTLSLAGGPITVNSANVTISGPASRFDQFALLNDNSGELVITNGRAFNTNGTLTNSGRLTIRELGSAFAVNGTLTNTGTITIDRGAVLRTSSLVNTGKLDLNADFVIDYSGTSPLPDLRAQIISGYANGAWNGSGLTSSSAAASPNSLGIGYAEAALLSPEVRALLQITDSTAVVARFTLVADATLDQSVSIGDFALLAANFGLPSTWRKGDFNYDGSTNISDFALLAANFGRSLAPPSSAHLTTAARTPVPEPSSATTLIALTSILRRRRRRSVSVSLTRSKHAL